MKDSKGNKITQKEFMKGESVRVEIPKGYTRVRRVKDGVWVDTNIKGFTHICCDCNSAHKVAIKLEKGKFYTRWTKIKLKRPMMS